MVRRYAAWPVVDNSLALLLSALGEQTRWKISLWDALILAAARASGHCPVVVIDNDSTDDSREWLAQAWPEIQCIHEPNRGLVSFNHVLPNIGSPYAVLLNNDVKLAEDSIDPLLDSLEKQSDALFSAPFCLGFDETTY